jgi:hypothetical protein
MLDFPVTNAVTTVGCILPSGAHVSVDDVTNVAGILRGIFESRHQLKEQITQRKQS